MNKINYKAKFIANAVKQTKSNWILLIMLISLIASSCRKLVEAPIPSESIADENVYSTDASSIAVLDGIYISMNTNNQPFQGAQSINLFAGLSADELTLFSGLNAVDGFYKRYYTNNLAQALGVTRAGAEHWGSLYNYIFKCNAAIEGLTKSKTLTPAIKQQLLGEAKFLRGFYYFYLVNMFGDVPLALTTDPEINTKLPRSSKTAVYLQIIADLNDAEGFLKDNYLDGTLLSSSTERVRPTKWAATALLARVYLYTNNNYADAENRASAVINNTSLFGPLPTLNNAFLKNSREAIWQLQPTANNFNTQEARTFVLLPPSTGPSATNPVFLSNSMVNSFEVNDQRAVNGNWINSRTIGAITYRFSYKYKINSLNSSITTASGTQNMTEYFMMLRLGEQYLIRAEARAQLNNVSGAQADLNIIRARAGLPNTTANTQSTLLAAILHERQIELFCEGGHRWFDLKRTGNIDAVMTIATPLKSNGTIQWRPYQALYPLPYGDLFSNNIPNPYLTQNTGY